MTTLENPELRPVAHGEARRTGWLLLLVLALVVPVGGCDDDAAAGDGGGGDRGAGDGGVGDRGRSADGAVKDLGSNQAFTCKKVVDNGSPSSKIDVFVLGNDIEPSVFTDYVAKQIDKDGTGTGFFSIEPFKSYKSRFNIYTLTPTARVVTFASGEHAKTTVQRFKQIAAQYCSVSEGDVDHMVVNTALGSPTKMYGFAYPDEHVAFVRATLPSNPSFDDCLEEFLHEFGHSFASFTEEYGKYGAGGMINLDSEACSKWCSGAIDASSPYYQYFKEWTDCVAPVKAAAKQFTLPNGVTLLEFTPDQRTALSSCYHTPAKKLWSAKKELLLAVSLGKSCLAGTGCYLHMPDDIFFRQTYGSFMGKATLGSLLTFMNDSIPLAGPFSDFSYVQSSDYPTVLQKYYSTFAAQSNSYGPYNIQYMIDLIQKGSQ